PPSDASREAWLRGASLWKDAASTQDGSWASVGPGTDLSGVIAPRYRRRVPESPMDPRARQTLSALRYAIADEAVSYLAIMRLFTDGMSGFLSDQSADEVTARLAEVGVDLDREVVDQRLSYLVEHGNLARSPRESEARSVREYLSNRSRYQLTQRGELVHRQVEELLAHADTVREVSSEMLPGILEGVERLGRIANAGVAEVEPREVAGLISTLFAQFEVLVTSTRQFYSYLTQVLTRFDLGREEFELFKSALVDYLQRFVDEISRHMPQVGDQLAQLAPHIDALCEHANSDERLVALDGTLAKRATGLDPDDWQGLFAWFVGGPGRRADADNVRRLATDAMRSLLTNLRRIAAGADRQQSRYGDLVRLAGWFDNSDDAAAHELWAAVFGLFPARHLGYLADSEDTPTPATTSWWSAPAAEVPVTLRIHGERKAGGRAGARVDFSAAKRARLAERSRLQQQRIEALRELAEHVGPVREVRLSDAARVLLLELYAQALARHGRPLAADAQVYVDTPVDGARLGVRLRAAPGAQVVIGSPQGRLTLSGVAVELSVFRADHHSTGVAESPGLREVR
ncbi:MAG TPA: TIGR02677 family protein, partial [Polyangiaceae bacterium]|nr:TIGR02677 family protein [Polyangiaceae bacterium]